MNQRILKRAAILAAIPLVTVLLTYQSWGSRSLMLSVLLLGTAVQTAAIQFCKLDLGRLVHPTDEMLQQLGAVHVPVPYEPGKYRIDARVTECGMWLSVPAPLLAFLARAFPKEYTVTVLNNFRYTGPNYTLLLLALLCTLLGAMSLCFWVYLEQARVVFSEPGENRRYLLNGFAEALQEKAAVNRILAVSRARRPVFRRI